MTTVVDSVFHWSMDVDGYELDCGDFLRATSICLASALILSL
jgi:hypothetical protein